MRSRQNNRSHAQSGGVRNYRGWMPDDRKVQPRVGARQLRVDATPLPIIANCDRSVLYLICCTHTGKRGKTSQDRVMPTTCVRPLSIIKVTCDRVFAAAFDCINHNRCMKGRSDHEQRFPVGRIRQHFWAPHAIRNMLVFSKSESESILGPQRTKT
jgi:hypothetical protein